MTGRKLIWIVTVLSLLIISVLIIVSALNSTEDAVDDQWNIHSLMHENLFH
ncbi:hypothetical protein [Oceanobacillus profundus]|uniref:hypothetical protein n=1 Tax=Oceanobacillus TaxID=182709 RepID=UPI0026E2FA31|nr:hypothetical protein [Oceanobacillus profundus]MDO6448655.1 hypothetical protein [Oceanobacillus profundus]